jgi:murein L,D-transpeptidase YafK
VKRQIASFNGLCRSSKSEERCRADLAAGRIVPKVDWVLVEKGARRLQLFFAGVPVREYRVSLGREPVGAKRRWGDGRTPEGRYRLDWRTPDSVYHRALHVSYPNSQDRRRAAEAGAPAGGMIMLHGLPEGGEWVGEAHRDFDWTEGCIAVTNEEMDEIWELVRDGTPIEIRP